MRPDHRQRKIFVSWLRRSFTLSQKKIDTKALIEDIFKTAPAQKPKLFSAKPKGSTAQEELLSLIGGRKKNQGFSIAGFSNDLLSGIRKNEFAGIDIGTDSIKFVLLKQERNQLYLQDAQIEKLVAGGDENATHAESEISNSLLKIASRVHPKMKVGLALNDPSVYMDFVSVPRGSEQELREAVRKQIAEQRLIEPKASFFDYTILIE